MRKTYLDNIRFGTVILVLVYHVFYIFNGVGVGGGIQGAPNIPALDTFSYFVYPWFMVLLFLIAGIGARYSLQSRSGKQFLRERVTKLLVPSTLGLFVIHWVTGYLNIKIGGGLPYIPPFLVYPISVISGIGPLWFIQALFLFSLLLVLVRKLDSKDTFWNLCGKANIPVLLLLVFPIWGAAQVLNMPLLTMYRFGIYGLAFFLGYFVFSHDAVQDSLEKIRIPMLTVAIALGVFYVYHYFGENYTSAQCLQSLLTNVYLWVAVLAVLGCGKAWLNRETRISDYMTKISFGIYILHYPVVLAACWVLYTYCGLPPILNYILALAAELILTPVLYELFKRIPVLRYFVLGIKKKTPGQPKAALPAPDLAAAH